MPLSYVTYTGTGVQTSFTFNKPYISKTHVKATVDGVLTSITVSGSTVTFSPAPADDSSIKIYRETPTTPLVNFNDGTTDTADVKNLEAVQSIYIAQETADEMDLKLGLTDGFWDADNKPIKNLPTATEDGEAVSFGQVNDVLSQASNAAGDAEAAAAAATALLGDAQDLLDTVESTTTTALATLASDLSDAQADIAADLSTAQGTIAADLASAQSDISDALSTLSSDLSAAQATIASDLSDAQDDIADDLAAAVAQVQAEAANLTATSTTSLAISVASKAFTIAAGKSFTVGGYVLATSDASPATNYMHGQITGYTGTTLTVNVTTIGGSGTHTDWTITISGPKGAAGAAGTLTDGDYGDITVSGTGAAMTIDNDVVTYAKMQNVSTTSRILGRKTAAAGDMEECTLSEILDMIGSAAQGDILYRGASGWARLGAGTNGYFLKTQGAAANPVWDAPAVSYVASGRAEGLKIVNNSGTPNTKIDVTANAVVMIDSSNNAICKTSLSVTVDFGVTGAAGIDTGAQASSTWYYLWAVAKSDGTTSVIGSTSNTSPTMPSGYTFKKYLGAVRSNGSTQFLRTLQIGNQTNYQVISGGNTTALPQMATGSTGTVSGTPTYTAVSISAHIPPTASRIGILLCTSNGNTIAASNNAYSGTSLSNPSPLSRDTANVANEYNFIVESTNIYWASDGANGRLCCIGWTDYYV